MDVRGLSLSQRRVVPFGSSRFARESLDGECVVSVVPLIVPNPDPADLCFRMECGGLEG